MTQFAALEIVAVFACGMGVIFYITDRRSPTSRALALCLFSAGLAIPAIVMQIAERDAPLNLAEVVFSRTPFEALSMIAGLEWGLRIALASANAANLRRDVWVVRLAQLLVAFYAALSIAFPEARVKDFVGRVGEESADPSMFWVYLAPLLAAGVLVSFTFVRRVGGQINRTERVRLLGALAAAPFLVSGLILPADTAPYAMSVGLLIFLASALRYHLLLGAQSAFLSRFLSPQIERMVRERGLASAMQTQRLVISVVCCDLRGFTAYARANAPEQVIRVLRDYYRAVGEVVASFGATVKDQAGDGILILVGAPIPCEDHAQRALDLARAIRARVQAMLSAWSDQRLGVGVGVASGQVAVGVIGDAGRLEYTAVGTAVNLASRLCEKALDGEIRVDSKTFTLNVLAPDACEAEPLTLKGFARPVTHSVIA